MSQRLLTAEEVANRLAVPESWVREATRAGHLPHIQLGRYRRYHPDQIEAWLAEQATASVRGTVVRQITDLP
jgi:excisionase family DNA binding protein